MDLWPEVIGAVLLWNLLRPYTKIRQVLVAIKRALQSICDVTLNFQYELHVTLNMIYDQLRGIKSVTVSNENINHEQHGGRT